MALLKTQEYSRNSTRKTGAADLNTYSILVNLSKYNDPRYLSLHLSIYRAIEIQDPFSAHDDMAF